MADLRRSNEAQCIACDGASSAGTRFHLEAAHVGAVDVRDSGVGLIVFGLADRGPFFGFGDAVYYELGETI